MATVTIKAIKNQNILSDERFEYIKKNLGKPLPLQDICWFRDGTLCSFAVYWKDSIIVLFPDTNKLKFEVNLQ